MSSSITQKNPAPEVGLSEAEADQRRARGLGNHVTVSTGRTSWQIVHDNRFNFINLTLFGISLSRATP